MNLVWRKKYNKKLRGMSRMKNSGSSFTRHSLSFAILASVVAGQAQGADTAPTFGLESSPRLAAVQRAALPFW